MHQFAKKEGPKIWPHPKENISSGQIGARRSRDPGVALLTTIPTERVIARMLLRPRDVGGVRPVCR